MRSYMHDQLLNERLVHVRDNCVLIISRTKHIITATDFMHDENGLLLLDAISMRLQVIGEHVKKIEKIYPDFFNTKLQLDPTPVIRFRDFISHHYEKTDYEIIFDICKTEIPEILLKVETHLLNTTK